jgi:uncharacterized protein YecT (DUF1311 family)
LDQLYGELYAIQYNEQRHLPLADPVEAAAAFAATDRRLNDAYQADLASTCLFKPAPDDFHHFYTSPEGLRDEQRAWLKLRDAWIEFQGLLFPDRSRQARTNMITSKRTFELQSPSQICEQMGHPTAEQ